MRGIPFRTIAIALALLLAGCLSGEEVKTSDIRTETSSSSSSAGNVQASARPGAAAVQPDANGTTDAVPTMQKAFPFSFEGKTSYSACAPSGPSSCSGVPLPTGSTNTFVELEYDGVPQGVDTTVTWAATTPATSEMYAYVFAVRSCGDGCSEWSDDMFSVYASGPSPLVLSATDVKLAPDELLYLHAGTVDPTPPLPVVFLYSLEQAFSVEGSVTALVNETA